MLPLIVLDPSERNRSALYKLAREQAAQVDCPIALLAQSGNIGEVSAAAEGCEGVLLLIAAARQDNVAEVVALSLRLLDRCRDSYFVYLAAGAAVLEALVNGCVRPAGLLLPPFTPGKFCAILKRLFADYLEMQKPRSDQLLVTVGGATMRLPCASVVCVEASEKRLTVYTSRQSFTFTSSLKGLAQKLGDGFMQCHRAYLINVRHAQRLDLSAMEITMDNGMRVPLARSQKNAIVERFREMTADMPFVAQNEPFVGGVPLSPGSVVG